MYSKMIVVVVGALALLLGLAACAPAAPPTPPPATAAPTPPAPSAKPALTDQDKSLAQELWQKMQTGKYRDNWTTVPGKGTFYQGQPPHGALLSTYLNTEASSGLKSKAGRMPDEAVVVKENYAQDKTLAGITVMYKKPGYDSQHKDWFWAAFKPDGAVDIAGKAQYCFSCHGAVQSNDFIFTFPVAPGPSAKPSPPGDKDKAMAQDLWQKTQAAKYRDSWTTVPGKGAFYKGQEPHGALLTTYLNPEAVKAVQAKGPDMPDGATIVKENYMPDKTLAAITVMYKERGFDTQHKDWFWAAISPDGAVQAAGKEQYCFSCHGAVQSNDYIFTFPLNVQK